MMNYPETPDSWLRSEGPLHDKTVKRSLIISLEQLFGITEQLNFRPLGLEQVELVVVERGLLLLVVLSSLNGLINFQFQRYGVLIFIQNRANNFMQ